MPADFSVTNPITGAETFYDSFKDARENSHSGDMITIYKDSKEKIVLKNNVDITIAPGVVFKKKEEPLSEL
ncbi:MAG: hypothetical protein ABIY50_09975 [Ignavibacteria bacterium]